MWHFLSIYSSCDTWSILGPLEKSWPRVLLVHWSWDWNSNESSKLFTFLTSGLSARPHQINNHVGRLWNWPLTTQIQWPLPAGVIMGWMAGENRHRTSIQETAVRVWCETTTCNFRLQLSEVSYFNPNPDVCLNLTKLLTDHEGPVHLSLVSLLVISYCFGTVTYCMSSGGLLVIDIFSHFYLRMCFVYCDWNLRE